jgi:hypothetical protein
MGKPARSLTLPAAACAAVLGLLLFSLLLIANQRAAAVGILCIFLVSSAGITSYNVAMEHFVEGVDLSIDVCKCALSRVAQSSLQTFTSTSSCHCRFLHAHPVEFEVARLHDQLKGLHS